MPPVWLARGGHIRAIIGVVVAVGSGDIIVDRAAMNHGHQPALRIIGVGDRLVGKTRPRGCQQTDAHQNLCFAHTSPTSTDNHNGNASFCAPPVKNNISKHQNIYLQNGF